MIGEEIRMYAELSFTEIDRQNAELLPARIVMSVVTTQPTGGTSTGSSTGGPSDFVKSCVGSVPNASPQNCQNLESALFALLLGPSSQK